MDRPLGKEKEQVKSHCWRKQALTPKAMEIWKDTHPTWNHILTLKSHPNTEINYCIYFYSLNVQFKPHFFPWTSVKWKNNIPVWHLSNIQIFRHFFESQKCLFSSFWLLWKATVEYRWMYEIGDIEESLKTGIEQPYMGHQVNTHSFQRIQYFIKIRATFKSRDRQLCFLIIFSIYFLTWR